MKTTILEDECRRQDEDLRETVRRIVERSKQLYSLPIEMVAERSDVESATSDDRFYIRSWRRFLFFKLDEDILLTAPRCCGTSVYNCYVQDSKIFDIAREEMERFCEHSGMDLVIQKRY